MLKKAGKEKSSGIADLYSRFGIIIILIISTVIASLLSDSFLTTRNLVNIFRQNAVIMIIAFGSQMVLISGGCDLSSGSVCALAGVISTLTMVQCKSVILSLLIGVGIGTLCGLGNGFMITRCRIPDFIMTLASQFMARGAVLVITNAQPVEGFNRQFTILGQGYVGPVPIPSIIMLLVLLFYWLLMSRHQFGRFVYAVGGNAEAARSSGIRVEKIKTLTYVFAGATAGLAGVLLMSRLNSGQPNGGEQYEFDAITASIIGGTSMSGGSGTVYGVVFGALLIGLILNIMTLVNVSAYWQMIVKGVIITVAVLIDTRVKYEKRA